jgi:hydroxymethylpyrimidine pyrophosphatase-like HAD family hydrolase
MNPRYTSQPYGFYKREAFVVRPESYFVYMTLVEMAIFKKNPKLFKLNRYWSIECGQLITSLSDLGRRLSDWNLSTQNIRTLLKYLKNHNLINIIANKGGMIITICNYNDWHQSSKKSNIAPHTENQLHDDKVYYQDGKYQKTYQPKYQDGKQLSEEESQTMSAFRRRQKEAQSLDRVMSNEPFRRFRR